MRMLLVIIRVATLAGATAWLCLLTLWAGPDFEAFAAPVLRRQTIDDLARTDEGRTVCFTWHFDKVRTARIVDAGWTLRDGDTIYPYQRVRTVDDSGDLGAALMPRPVEPGQWSRKCVDVPAALVDRPFLITGFVEYRTPGTGLLWHIRQPTAEARVE